MGLLVEHAGKEKALERLTAALEDPRPNVRAAAARVAYVSVATAFLPTLEAALAKETNRAAASEMIRAVASYGGLGKTELLLSTAERLGLADTVGVALAAAHQHAALPYLDRLRTLDPKFPLARFLQLATRSGGLVVLGPHTAKAFRENDEAYWEAYLETARIGISKALISLISTLGSTPYSLCLIAASFKHRFARKGNVRDAWFTADQAIRTFNAVRGPSQIATPGLLPFGCRSWSQSSFRLFRIT